MAEQLRQERDCLETITGNIGAGLGVISADYKILWANRVLKAIFGEVGGRACFETIYRDIPPDTCNARKVLTQGLEKAIQDQVSRERRPDAKVIICSGYGLDGPTQALMDAGADGSIQKPFSLEDLAQRLRAVLPQRP